MNPLKDFEYNPALPLQTKRGAQQALRCGHNKVDQLIDAGVLNVVYLDDRIPKITTESIERVAATGYKTKPSKPTITTKPAVIA
jgi:hypothetical protein